MDILHRLLDRADALVSNLAPGSTARLGLSAADLAERHPERHPRRDRRIRPGRPDLAQARIRPADPGGRRDRAPSPGIPDMPAKPGPADGRLHHRALRGAVDPGAAVLARPAARDPLPRSGLSLFDVLTDIMGYQLTYTQHSGIDQQPLGVGSPAVAPYGAFPTRDGQTVVLGTTNDREWQRVAREIIDRPDLADDPRFATNTGRCAHRDDSRRGDRILVRAARSRAHPEGGRRGRDRQLALQPAQRGGRPSAAHRPRPMARGGDRRRGRSRRCCRRRSSPDTIRRWARFPGWASTPTRCWQNSVWDRTTSPQLREQGAIGPPFADSPIETNGDDKCVKRSSSKRFARRSASATAGCPTCTPPTCPPSSSPRWWSVRASIPEIVDDVVWGCVSQVGDQSSNIGRYSVLAAGWPETIPGTTVNRACGSSQQALDFAVQAVMSGQQDVVVAGGVEVDEPGSARLSPRHRHAVRPESACALR